MGRTTLLENENRSWFARQIKGVVLVTVISMALAFGVNALRGDGIPLVEDWHARMSQRTLPDGLSSIPFEEARDLYENQSALFLDARSPESYIEGHIPGALNLPVYEFDSVFPELEPELYSAAIIVTYCSDVTCEMAEELAVELALRAFSNIHVYLGGLEEWRKLGETIDIG